MAAPTAEELKQAYLMMAKAECDALKVMVDEGKTLLEAVDAAAANLPKSAPVSSGVSNLLSWRNTILSIVNSADGYINQYPSEVSGRTGTVTPGTAMPMAAAPTTA